MFRTAMTIGGFDPELDAALKNERQRQEDHIELIASENYVSPRVLAHLRKYQPEFILLQAGADSVEGDPITHMRFTAECHQRAARDLAQLAEELGHGRVLGTGGGGYNRINLAQAWTGVVQGLVDTPVTNGQKHN